MTKSSSHAVKARIVLVEDHPITREGFARLLDFEQDLQVCGQAGTAAEALLVVEKLKPDLVIVDISLVGRSGLDLIKDLVMRYPKLAIIALSTYDESIYGERAIRAGARTYIMKSESTERILYAIRQILRGKPCLSEWMQQQLMSRITRKLSGGVHSDVAQLSDRELEVFQLLGRGQSTAQIAATLNLSGSTVATHRNHIQDKLHLKSLTELVCHAAQWVQSQRPRSSS